ncbi:unnamed protein product [Caenorhabditis sp. 36 PRJEB53466]|nr:unnamed protein product [Caenorhabditis sp. 36 PRJEB53466]
MVIVIFLVTLLALLCGYFKWLHTYWKRKGIDGPSGFPFIGSFYQLADRKFPRGLIINQWTKTYGQVFGYYEGATPVLVISDLEMLQEMFVKKFDCFYHRKMTHMITGNLESVKEEPRVNLFSAQGSRWKRLRALMTPVFSVKSVKKIHATMEDSVLAMVALLEKHVDGEPFNILEYYQELTYDVVSRLAMGQPHSELFNNEQVDMVRKIFDRTQRVWPWYLTVTFPYFKNAIKDFFFKHPNVRGGDVGKLHKICENAVQIRLKERAENAEKNVEKEQNDFIDMFLDYYSESVKDGVFGETVEKKVTADDVVGACFLFLLAGFDTTANTLAYASYLLAKNPAKMDIAQEEVTRVCRSPNISYDEIVGLKYMDAVVKESMRLYPVGAFACSRTCMKSTTLGNLQIDVGVSVEADVHALHRSTEIWGDNPDVFFPERWLDPNAAHRHNMSWIPFGAGPRQCVGIRMGMIEVKLALAHILRKYSMIGGAHSEKELNLIGCATMAPEKVTVYLETRFG